MNPYLVARTKERVFATHCPCGGEVWVPGHLWEPGQRIAAVCDDCGEVRLVALYIVAEIAPTNQEVSR